MKKIILTILSFILLFSYLICYNLTIKNNTTLNGLKITENLYKYDLNNDNRSLSSYSIIDNNIYFLLDTEEYYELFIRDIYSSKNTSLGKLDTKSYCELKEDIIICTSVDKAFVYDLNLNLKYETNLTPESLSYIIPYKDTYLKLNSNILSLNQASEEIEFRTINKIFKDFQYLTYYKTKENTYLLFYNQENNYYIYNIKENKYDKISSSNYITTPNGFYFYNSSKYQIYNLKDNKVTEYTNKFFADTYLVSTMSKNSSKLYTLDTIEKNLKIIDFETETLKSIPLPILDTGEALNIIENNNYLYIFILTNKINLYLFDLSATLETININEYMNEFTNQNKTKITELETNYHLKIKTEDEVAIKYPDFSAEVTKDYRLINKALTKVESVIKKLNPEFLDTFFADKKDGLNIYLTGELTPSDLKTQVNNPAAYSLFYNNEYMIVLNIKEENLNENFCHELMHNIELNMKRTIKDPFPNWNTYNPQDFNYTLSYTTPSDYNYTIYELAKNDVYFIDKYSHSYPVEDRARIFEKICAYEENSIVKEFPNLLNKANYLKETLTSTFKTLENTPIFQSLD